MGAGRTLMSFRFIAFSVGASSFLVIATSRSYSVKAFDWLRRAAPCIDPHPAR